jgi:CubicO group peptidase (beta-lactamase class C family)
MQSTAVRFAPAPNAACTLNAMAADDPQTSSRSDDPAPPVEPGARPLAGGASRVGEDEERVGPLLLSRWRKDDGRALLLYRRPADGQTDEQ